ncbi:toll/interleukin-1 receptor domain-containing protein [Photobacterium sp. 53610]|uniref:toll/interleukin-1 receptor domain-containing protein n=1 Tax=Photobacterium sp. 53610 TaxID=3102789 RepID=UPI002ED9E8F9
MTIAFLSHSSKDKESYVRNVANWLQKDNIIYDEFTFEEGEKSIDEIILGLEQSSLFVLFISNNSLDSDWVKREISEAKNRLDKREIDKIFPIVIDDTSHDDKRIPDWLKEYNLRPVKRSSVAAKKIHNKLREISWSKHPRLKERDELFIGRLTEMDEFEQRIHDFFSVKPLNIVCSGFSGVGRRRFMYEGLKKTGLVRQGYSPSVISIDRNASIEDFILSLNDFGLVDFGGNLENMSDMSIDKKVSLIHEIMDAAKDCNEILFIIDNGSLINYKRELSDWFMRVIDTYDSNRPIFCIASKYKVLFKNRPKDSKTFFIELNELNAKEREMHFSKIAGLYNLDITPDQFHDICDLLCGYPDQVTYAAELLKHDTQSSFADKMTVLSQYSQDKASVLLAKYENNKIKSDFIRMLSKFEIISTDFIFSILPEVEYYPILEELASEHIVELIGSDREMIRLNDIVRDYISRNRINLDPAIQDKISKKVRETVQNDDLFEIDSSQMIFAIKETLKNGGEIDEKYLIPTHYLRCMKDMYYNKGNLSKIIDLAYKILSKERNIDEESSQDIRYYLCLSLAKTKNKKFLTEVQHIKGDEHNFLMGFYYRLQGRYQEALERFNKIIDNVYVAARVKREIVQVYVHLEEYDKALEYAKNNYESNRGNQFHTQAYFNCLINSNDNSSKEETLKTLIENLRGISSEQSNEMADIAEAIFLAKIKNNKVASLDKIKDCVDKYPTIHYPLLSYCDIALKFQDIDEFKLALDKLESIKNGHVSDRTMNKYRAFNAAFDNDLNKALSFIERDLSRYPADSRQRMEEKLESLARTR